MSVSLFINFHKLRCHIVFKCWNLFKFGVCKGVKSFGKQSKNCTVYFKTAIKANRVDKRYQFLCNTSDKAALVKYPHLIEVTSQSNIRHCYKTISMYCADTKEVQLSTCTETAENIHLAPDK